MRTVAAALNGSLVLAIYFAAWGVPSGVVGVIELVLAAGAMVSTWYALKKVQTPPFAQRLAGKIVGRCIPA